MSTQEPEIHTEERQGPLGDIIPTDDGRDTRTQGGQKPEKVEDRPNVGQVKPEDYPEAERNELDP